MTFYACYHAQWRWTNADIQNTRDGVFRAFRPYWLGQKETKTCTRWQKNDVLRMLTRTMALEKHSIRDGVPRAFPILRLRKNRRFGDHRGTERRTNVPAAIPLIGGGTGGEKLHHARTTAMVEMT